MQQLVQVHWAPSLYAPHRLLQMAPQGEGHDERPRAATACSSALDLVLNTATLGCCRWTGGRRMSRRRLRAGRSVRQPQLQPGLSKELPSRQPRQMTKGKGMWLRCHVRLELQQFCCI